MNEAEKKYFIAPSGRPFVAEITRDDSPSNPEESEPGAFIMERDDFPPYLHDARDAWVDGGHGQMHVEGLRFLRYLRIFQRGTVRIAAVIERNYYGGVSLDFDPSAGWLGDGLFILTHDDVREMSGGDPKWETDEKLREIMIDRAETYSSWATGDAYGVEVRTFSEVGLPDPDESDGPTWNCYGMAHAESAIMAELPDGTREVSKAEYEEYIEAAMARRAAVDMSDLDEAAAQLSQAKRERIAAAGLTWQD